MKGSSQFPYLRKGHKKCSNNEEMYSHVKIWGFGYKHDRANEVKHWTCDVDEEIDHIDKIAKILFEKVEPLGEICEEEASWPDSEEPSTESRIDVLCKPGKHD